MVCYEDRLCVCVCVCVCVCQTRKGQGSHFEYLTAPPAESGWPRVRGAEDTYDGGSTKIMSYPT